MTSWLITAAFCVAIGCTQARAQQLPQSPASAPDSTSASSSAPFRNGGWPESNGGDPRQAVSAESLAYRATASKARCSSGGFAASPSAYPQATAALERLADRPELRELAGAIIPELLAQLADARAVLRVAAEAPEEKLLAYASAAPREWQRNARPLSD